MKKIIDVTLRDGGLANNFSFSTVDAIEIIEGLSRAGVEYTEIGYFKPFEWHHKNGPEVCNHQYLASLCNHKIRNHFVIMAHTWELHPNDYKLLKGFDISLVRLPVLKKNLHELESHCFALKELEIPISINIIRLSEMEPKVLFDLSILIEKINPEIIYLADSNGSIIPKELERYIHLVKSVIPNAKYGFHPHDNLNMAFANSLVAFEHGFEFVDSSIGGLGKGGLNLMTELLLSYLNKADDAEYRPYELFKLYKKYIRNWILTKCDDKFINLIFGLMNTNMDTINELYKQSKNEEVSIESLVMQKYSKIFNDYLLV
ncbi:4-hyroxy-2-oxovalerate/4-hydroxy-2-oxopentanoic acid aldolase [Leptospira santarosai]|uniref:4-hyroxy-2-oxovalerate/4-hydroxy-2-oxopentanoic acid aldolase n=1 Tax=Leptospira santarosai TaxID=28183 RepID=UPI0002BEBA3E|nr:4-hyroxy-2-oxovalerate/4-hydroxy-2-oxopentanoic acid aldolase [Leptospira santarosai]EMO73465.1 4-hyroxy-2-oxovalerate/4-hydroxy-2-oxopentanoic acid aldolase family protein [Leptospira santarosai str. 200403458]EMO98229.1 4-hyroxy-2-oxovalerate/4-hydroxy-2-oxopentanoic acid aldolase family protein [Leptospira santarosai str. 200702252]